MTVVLDTNVLIDRENGDKGTKEALLGLQNSHPDNIHLALPVVAEYYYGLIERSENKGEADMSALQRYSLLSLRMPTMIRFAEIKHRLDREGNKIPLFDTMIAANVIENDMTLVTYDRHFERVSELNLELISDR